MDLIQTVLKKRLAKAPSPEFRTGDTVQVHVKIVEGEKSRVQVFEGVVIKRSGSGINGTFTVRKISNGVGVERIFPIYSAAIDRIDVISRGSTRRSKLYYLRDLEGKAARIDSSMEQAATSESTAQA
ncbi:MAG: 50S ribosomal protein L19 [Oligoflexia bacterium]|nr:50S ribosomal protein L19 [Oligoflexia bacterium]